ncbi:hypothetical protein ACHAWF_009549 [Thalassiosira exigua]
MNPPPPPPPEMPDVTDTGTVIGSIRPQPPAPPPAPPALVLPDDGPSADGMDVDPSSSSSSSSSSSDSAPVDEEEALRMVEKLRSDDLPSRVEAARKLPLIAAALGPRRTRDELLPFLADGTDDDDEVLAEAAASLGKLVPFVGGNDRAGCLLGPLELLLAVEENAVRDKAAASAVAVSDQMTEEAYDAEYVGMISRLASKEWFTARVSACGLIPSAYPRMTPSARSAHAEKFAALCGDDAPMVRRIASRNLGPMLKAVADAGGPSCLVPDDGGGSVVERLLEQYEALAGGDQPDSVRLHATQNCVEFGRAMASIKEKASASASDAGSSATGGEDDDASARVASLVRRVLPLVVATIDDRSWRVRWTAASKFADVVRAFAPLEGTMDALVPAYEKLLQDPEAEVRTAAAFNLSEVAKTAALVYDVDAAAAGLGADASRVSVAARLVRQVMRLTEDESESVRAAVAMVATDLAPVLGRDASVSHLLPPMLLLLRDSTSEVRLNVISSLSLLNDVVGPELLAQSLLPAILDLAEDGKWRIRLAVIERIPLLAKQLGEEFFTDRLLTLCVGWLGDDISSIRVAAAAGLKELTSLLGTEWSVRNLLPRVKRVAEHPSYLRRTNAVRACALMASAMDPPAAQHEALPLLLEMHCDPVPNVRFNVAKGLGELGPRYGRTVYEGQIGPVLALMREDPDRDVRYFATIASDALAAHFDGADSK